MADPFNKNNGVESSFLTKPAAIFFWLALCIIAVLFEKTQIALFLGFVFVLTAVSYLWARAALKNVDIIRNVDHIGVYPGQVFYVNRTVINRKALPLIWLEIREACKQDEPASPRPEHIISIWEYNSSKESSEYHHERLYTVSLVHWFGRITFPDQWTAHRRGIMSLSDAVVRSGDGFGLSAVGKTFEVEAKDRIIVFPTIVDVSVSSIVNDMWDTRSRTTGYLEDRSVIKSIRDYQAGDPVRNINMRLLSQGQSLKTNVYEIVTPNTILFVLDSGSFETIPNQVFEDVLSVTASLIEALSKKGISVALFVPASDWYDETYTKPSCSESDRYEMFALLAAASKNDGPMCSPPPSWVEEAGKIYYVAGGTSLVKSPGLLVQLPEHKIRFLTPDALDTFRRKEKVV